MTTANQDNQLTDVYILGQLGKALYRRDGQCFVYSLEDGEEVPCEKKEIGLWLDTISEYSVISQMKQSDLPELLKESANAYDALSFTLNGLDADLEELRPRAIQMANKLCRKSEKVHTFVQNRLLGYPFPQEADLEDAITFAQGCEKILNLYEGVRDNLDSLQVFHDIWKKVVSQFFSLPEQQARVLRVLVNKGVIKDLVMTVTARQWTEFNQIWKNIQPSVEEQSLLENKGVDVATIQKLLTALKHEFANRSKVFINAWSNDAELAGQIKKILVTHGFLCELLKTELSMSGAAARKNLEKNLLETDAVIVVRGQNTPLTWIREQTNQCRRILAKRGIFKVIAIFNGLASKLNFLLDDEIKELPCPTLHYEVCVLSFVQSL